MANVDPIPQGYRTLSPYLVVQDPDRAIDFYKKAFGAEEVDRMTGPDGKTVMHATLRIGDSMLMLTGEFPNMGCKSPKMLGGSPVTVHMYVRDVDSAYKRAIGAGATAKMQVADMFWGDRFGTLTDPFGHEWSIATHKQNLTKEQITAAAKAAFSGKQCGGCGG